MGLIRKRTSKRGTTNQREKIKHKVSETRKKRKKEVRKAKATGRPLPNKKSKKDPGIPNNFPYKDQILAEVEEQRRNAAEEKEQRKEQKRAAKLAGKNGDPAEESAGEDDGEAGSGEYSMDDDDLPTKDGKGFDGITSLRPGPSTVKTAKAKTTEEVTAPSMPSILITPGPPTLDAVLDAADAVLHVVDIRDPAAGVCKSIMGTLKGKGKSEAEDSDAQVKGKNMKNSKGKVGKKGKGKSDTESQVEDKEVLLILNKIDTVPRESVDSWLQHFRSSPPDGVSATLPFRSASKFLPVSPSAPVVSSKKSNDSAAVTKTDDALGTDAIWKFLREKAAELKEDKIMVVAIVGVTNSGKTALVNSLARNFVSAIYTSSMIATKGKESNKPYTTTNAVEIVLDIPEGTRQIRIVDTPGIEFVRNAKEDDSDAMEDEEKEKEKMKRQQVRARDILLRNRGKIDKLKDPLFALNHIVSRADTQDLMLAYNLPAFAAGDATAFLAGLARVNGLIKKGGLLDHAGAARIALKDWSSGKFARYTMAPPSSSAPLTSSASSALYEKDLVTLSTMRTRKEMRKSDGVKLVKMSAGEVDERLVVFDEEWGGDDDSEDDEGGEECGEDAGEEVDEDDEETTGDVEADSDDSDEAPTLLPPAPTPKRKRTVSFAVPPKGRAPKKVKGRK